MIQKAITIRVDATNPPIVAPGDRIDRGQKVCTESDEAICPVSGTIQSVRFDPEAHEFVILVAPA